MTENDISVDKLTEFPDPIEHPELFDEHCSKVIDWLIEHPKYPWIMFKTDSGMLNDIPTCQIAEYFIKFLRKRALTNPDMPVYLRQKGTTIILEKVI